MPNKHTIHITSVDRLDTLNKVSSSYLCSGYDRSLTLISNFEAYFLTLSSCGSRIINKSLLLKKFTDHQNSEY